MRTEPGCVVLNKLELAAFGSFVSKDVFRPHLSCLQLSPGSVFSTDGHRILIYEDQEFTHKAMVSWDGLARVMGFMRNGDEMRLMLRKTRPVAMVGKNVFPLSYEEVEPVPYKQVVPERGKFERFTFNPKLLESLTPVAKSLGMQLTRATLEASSTLGALLFSFPENPKWTAVVMSCRE